MNNVLIFLDIDGVLNHFPFNQDTHSIFGEGYEWSIENTKAFSSFIGYLRNNGFTPKVVIASSWGRKFKKEADLGTSIFNNLDIECEVVAVTQTSGGLATRSEIPKIVGDLIREHQCIDKFFVIADDYISCEHKDCMFVHTKGTEGFTEEVLNSICKRHVTENDLLNNRTFTSEKRNDYSRQEI